MVNRKWKRVAAGTLVLSFAMASLSCGNALITASEREQTLTAIMSKAEYAYDKSRFDESERLFRQALDMDPTYQDARIRLSYASNAVAGLSILDFVIRFVVQDGNKGTSDPNKKDDTSKSLSILTNTLGLDAAEATRLKTFSKDVATLRANSPYFAKLHESWQTICPLIPASVFETVFNEAPDALKDIFGQSSCKGGLSSAESPSPAALFSAALQFMAQAAGLFQIGLDSDNDNEIDLAAKGLKTVEELSKLQTIVAGTDPTSVDAASYAANLAAINTQLETIQSLKNEIDGEFVNYTLTCFTFISALVAQNLHMPPEIRRKIERALSKINEGQAKLAQYTSLPSFGSGSSGSSQGAKVKEAAEKASAAIDELYNKVNELPEGQEKTERLAELNDQRVEVCSNFEKTKSDFGLEDKIQTPQQCQGAAYLAQHSNSPDSNKNLESQDNQRKFWLVGPIPLPSELNSEARLADGIPDDLAGDNRETFMSFLRIGGALRNR